MITIPERHTQTDGQTDGQTTYDSNTALCTKVHRAVKITFSLQTVQLIRSDTQHLANMTGERVTVRQTEYRVHCWQTVTWQTADGLVWSPALQAAVGMLTVSCRQTAATPVHTDCCGSMSTTEQNHEVGVLGRAVGK